MYLYKYFDINIILLHIIINQGLFVVIDQFVSNRQWHFEKIWTCLPFGVTYVIFNVVYWAAGGLDPWG